MTDEQIAALIAQSNAALAATLAGVLHQFRAPLAPTIKLAKFMGHPVTAGDPTLVEWLDQFDVYARQAEVSDVNKAVVLLDHLGGCAREEVLCHPDAVRNDYGALVALLKLHFAPHETVHSLSAEFYARVQLGEETLAEYSRVLMGLHNRIEKAAATEAEGQALAVLRDTALKGQFIKGVQKQSVRQELRRIALHSAGKPFHHMRNEALYPLDEERHCAKQGGDLSPVNSRLLEIAQVQQELQKQVMELASQQCQAAGQMQVVIDQLPSLAGQPQLAAPARPASSTRPNPRDGSCFYCRKHGHFVRECPKKRTSSVPLSRRGSSCFHGKQEGHFVHDCPQKKCVSVRSRGPEQSSAQVTCLASDQIDGALSKGVTERLGIAEGRIVELEGRLLEAETLEVQLRQQVVTLQAGQEQMRRQGEELHREAREKRGFAERLEKANGEISALRGNVESARADVMVASSKNSQLLSQLKGNQVAYGALVEQLKEMREELGELKSQFCKQVAELQSNLSAVCSKRDATVCLCETTQVDAELFQSQVERLECERGEAEVSRKHRNWLAAWRQPYNLFGRKANVYRWCRKWHTSACL